MTSEGLAAPLLRMVGPTGAVDVWLETTADRTTLESEIRAVGTSGSAQLSDLAMALGAIARRHGLDVRVISKADADGPRLLVVFARRTRSGTRR